MSTVRYTDTQLWDIPKHELDTLKRTLTFNDFSKWAIDRLYILIKESVDTRDWMNPDESHLRTYRVKAQKFYEEKLIEVY